MADYSRACGRAEPVAILGIGGTVFVFPGHGSHWTQSAVELLDSSPAFADEMSRCDAAFAEFVDWSLLEAVRGGAGSPSLDRVDVLQPVLFAVMVSLAAQWRDALGIHPDAVLGHSHGEIAAAYVAGGLSLAAAARVIALRSKAVSAIAGTGGMVMIRWPADRVLELIEPWHHSISIAAQDGPSSTVITGYATGAGRADGRMRAGPACLPRGFLLATPHIRPRSNRCARRCARRFPGCNREPATSHSFRGSLAPGWTRRSWTATTGSPTCANRCCSNRPSDGPTSTATAHSSKPVRTRC